MDFRVFLRLFSFFESMKPGGEDAKNESLPLLQNQPIPIATQIILAENDPTNSEDCRGNLGCFPTSSPWWGIERPVSLSPETLEDLKPFFCFHSKQNPICQKIVPESYCNLGNIDITQDTLLIFITHGFLHSTDIAWIKTLVTSLLDNLDNNVRVLTLDWKEGASPPYAQAVANTRLMGALAGRLLQCLVKEKNLKLAHTHLIGHSLGSHLFGYTGNYLCKHEKGALVGRITGLDPAGPYFLGTPSEVHLDHTDAFFVDVFHTDSTSIIPTIPVSLGLSEASGHLDFFPNGGGQQKGCFKIPKGHLLVKKGIRKGVLEFIGCSHERAHRYLTSSISERCNYIGVECTSWTDFKEGKCWDCSTLRCFKMGIDVERVYPQHFRTEKDDFYHVIAKGENKIKLYLATTDDGQVCGNQYRFSIVVSDSEASRKQGSEYANFEVTIRGENGIAQTNPRKGSIYLSPGDNLQWVDAIPASNGEITSVVITYKEDQDMVLQQLIWRISTPALYIQEFVVESLLNNQRLRFYFCEEKISFGETVILKQRCNYETTAVP